MTNAVLRRKPSRVSQLCRHAMQITLGGAAAALLALGGTAYAAVDGETFRTSGGENWSQTGSYSKLTMGVWKDGAEPSDGGTARFVTPGEIKLAPTAGLELGAIEVLAGVTANLTTRGLTMVGDSPYIQIQAGNNASFQIDTAVPLSGTGANTLTLKTAPGYGVGIFNLYDDLPNFSLLDIDSGAIYACRTGAVQTLLTTGSVRLSGGSLSYVAAMASAGDASASIATGAGSTFTFAPGPARLRVERSTNADTATLTVGPIAREGRAAAELASTTDGDNTLGVTTFIKTTSAPTLVNGFVEPWLVVKGQNNDATEGADHVDFLTYDADKGFVPATALYDSDFGDPAAVVSKTVNSEAITINSDTQVQGLRIVSIGGQPTLTLNATLTAGDGTHPAGVLLNYRGGGNYPFLLDGTGALDFGTSEGIIWCSPNQTDNRRMVQISVPVKGSNGITFAAPTQTAGRAPIIQPQDDAAAAWTGPLHLRNVRYRAASQARLPSPDVYVYGRGAVRGAQVLFSTTLTNHFHVAGNGLQDTTDKAGALNGAGVLNGPITLEHDATFFSTGTFTANGAIDGNGTLTLRAEGNVESNEFVLAAANTYDGPTSLVNTKVTLGANGTFGTGPVTVDARSIVRVASATKTIPNAISGTGKMQLAAATVAATGKNDVGTLAFDGNSAEAVATVSTFTATDTTVAAVNGRGVIDGTAFTVKSDADGEFHAELSGSASLVKDGTGTLSLCADIASSGSVTVHGGTLRMAGRLDAPFTDSLSFHLDATRGDTFKYADDGTITNWASTVGNVSFKSAGGVYTGPRRLESGWNSLPVVKFEAGCSNRLYSSVAVAPRTLFFVVRPRPDDMITCAGLFGQAGTDHNGVRAATHLDGGKWTWDSGAGTGSHHVFDSNGSFVIDGGKAGYREIAFNTPQVIVAEKSDAATTRDLSFTAGLGGYCNAAYAVYGDRNLDGDIAEVIAYDRVLTESERKRVENYLGRKWKDGDFYDGVDSVSLAHATLTLSGDGVLDLAGSDVTVASLSGTGLITNSSARAATLTVSGASTFSGEIRGNVKVSAGGGTVSAALSDDASLAVSGNTTLGVYNYQPPAQGLLWWMDAADASTITTNVEGKVTRWNSRGGLDVYFGSDGANPVPVYAPAGHANAMGNKPGIWYNGVGKMRLKSSGSKSVKTTFLVWNATADGVAKATAAGVYGYRDVDAGIRYWSGLGIQYCHTCSPFSNVDYCYVDGNKLQNGTYGTSGAAAVPADKVHVLSAVAGAGRSAPERTYVFGAYHSNSGDNARCFIGWICEAIAYDRCLSEAERRQVEDYLIAKWKGAGAITPNTAVGGSVTVAENATLTVAGGAPLDVGTISGGGAIAGDVNANGFEVTVKPNGAVDKLTVAGTLALSADAFLQVNNSDYLLNNNFVTFLEATGVVGTFAGSNLTEPCGWSLRNGCGQVYRVRGFLLIFR